jgi:hypothetical protein
MKFNPYSIEHAPVSLPIWHTILEDLNHPPPKRIAKVLGLGLRTIFRYNRDGYAPRHVCMALFWLTRWGRSAVHCQAVNDCQLAVSYANSLEREVEHLGVQLAHLIALNATGAANEPIEDFYPPTAPQAPPAPEPTVKTITNRAGGTVRWQTNSAHSDHRTTTDLLGRMADRDPLWMALSRGSAPELHPTNTSDAPP